MQYVCTVASERQKRIYFKLVLGQFCHLVKVIFFRVSIRCFNQFLLDIYCAQISLHTLQSAAMPGKTRSISDRTDGDSFVLRWQGEVAQIRRQLQLLPGRVANDLLHEAGVRQQHGEHLAGRGHHRGRQGVGEEVGPSRRSNQSVIYQSINKDGSFDSVHALARLLLTCDLWMLPTCHLQLFSTWTSAVSYTWTSAVSYTWTSVWGGQSMVCWLLCILRPLLPAPCPAWSWWCRCSPVIEIIFIRKCCRWKPTVHYELRW